MTSLLKPYLGRKDIEGIHKYKYAGADEGFFYIHFYNPMANFLVEFLPKWLAPNTVTLIGFLILNIPFIVLWTFFGANYDDMTTNPIPSWLFFLQAICFFAYRMLDEMDGK